MTRDVDLNALQGARDGGSVTPRLDRRTDLFRVVSHLPADQAPKGLETDRSEDSPERLDRARVTRA
ncbi:MAG TPA: hypothetical protein VGC79_25605 [Polyangiaceae bacterium]